MSQAHSRAAPRARDAVSADAAPLRVGLIGLGAIGLAVARLVREKEAAGPGGALPPDRSSVEQDAGRIEIVGALVRDVARSRGAGVPPLVATVEALLAARPEVVVEVAGHDALRAHGPAVLRAGCDLLLVSAGALADPRVEAELRAAAREGGGRARVASGAIGGLDALSAAAIGGLTRVTHTTRKPARTLLGAAAAAKLDGPLEVFRGSARNAALRFPESVNVMAAVALAGIGMDRTEARVIADPKVSRNEHTVEAEGEFGWLRFEIANVPTEENPRTGRIVAMSVVRELRARRASLSVG